MKMIIITGMSGAGKSQAATFLEDIGFFCIDNMPPTLIPTFAEMALQLNQFQNVAIVTDIRAGRLFAGFFECLSQLKSLGMSYKTLFLDASDDTIARRYRETRRAHPLAVQSDSPIYDAIRDERKAIERMREAADYYIDTTQTTREQLREMVQSLFLENRNDALRITCISFGFKYSVPTESNIVLDVRYLPNPFYIEALKEQTGIDDAVKNYVFSFPETDALLERFYSLVDYLLPLYKREGKSQLVLSVGCTGGKHRSVVIVEEMAAHIAKEGYPVSLIHRDLAKMV